MSETEENVLQNELIENVIATAQRLIRAEKDKAKVTPPYISDRVDKAIAIFCDEGLSELDKQRVITVLIQRFSHWIGRSTTLKDETNHLEWLSASRKREWHYWRRYRDFLESKLSNSVFEG